MTVRKKTKSTMTSNESSPTEHTMTTRKKSDASNATPTEQTMTTTHTKSHASNPTTTEQTMTTHEKPHAINPSTTEQTMTAPATSNPVTTTLAINPADVIFIAPPPTSASIPAIPSGFTPVKGGLAPALKPKKTEAGHIGGAVSELQSFVDYTATLGKAAPPHAQVVQMFDAANKWTAMRLDTQAWARYAANEEGVAWTGVRSMMDRLKPSFDLAVRADPTLSTKYPKLSMLIGAKSAIAKKSVSTRKGNKKEVAEGKTPTHGAAAKKSQKEATAAAKVAATQTQHASPAPAVVATAQSEPSVQAQPQPTTATPAVTNGAAHS